MGLERVAHVNIASDSGAPLTVGSSTWIAISVRADQL